MHNIVWSVHACTNIVSPPDIIKQCIKGTVILNSSLTLVLSTAYDARTNQREQYDDSHTPCPYNTIE